MRVCLIAILACAAFAGEHALVGAARNGEEDALTRLLAEGADPNTRSSDGTTALHWAAQLDSAQMTAALLDAGASPDATNRYGVTPLMLAAANGNGRVLGLLIAAEADACRANDTGETPLMIAARAGNPDALRVLLGQGANPNDRERARNQTPLMWAASEGHHAAVQLLLEAGAERDTKSVGGFTALLFAVRQGHPAVVRHLLDAGADVNQTLGAGEAKDGPHALGLAVINAHYELAAMLLEAGADPNHFWQGRNVLHTLTWVRRPGAGSNNPSPPGSGSMDSLELVRRLAAHGIHLDAQMTTRRAGVRTVTNMEGATAFLLAARAADAPLMRVLAELGADPHIPNSDGTTPLLIAAGVGVQSPGEDPGTPAEVFEAVKLALELGAEVNAVDRRGETAMHGAAYKFAASTVPLLIAHGADIEVWNRKNAAGWTPLRIAAGVHRTMNLRGCPETAAAIRAAMIAAGVEPVLEPETGISGETR